MREMIKKVLPFLAIILAVFLAYGQTLRMYFWQDDSATIFKLLHLHEPAGSFGEGIIGSGPYKYLISFFVPFFPFFKLEPFYYFLVGFLSYFLVVLVFSFLVKVLVGDIDKKETKTIAFFATLVFVAGYIGSDIMFRISNSWQSNLGLILAILSFAFFAKVFRDNKKRIVYYLLSLFLFWACIEFVYIRSHSLIFPILAIDILLAGFQLRVGKIFAFILRQIPFWFIFYLRYLMGESMGSSALTKIIQNLLQGKFEILSGLVATIGNGFVPDTLQSYFIRFFPERYNFYYLLLFIFISWFVFSTFKLRKSKKLLVAVFLFLTYLLNRHFIAQGLYWYETKEAFIAGASGFYVSVIVIFLTIFLWKKYKTIIPSAFLGYLIFVSQIFGYYIQYPDSIFSTTHRYLNYPFIGYALVVAGVTFALYKVNKKRGICLLSGVVFLNLVLGFHYQAKVVRNRSLPTKQFYTDLKTLVPTVKRGAAFYFDAKADPFIRQQFNDFFSVGSMPNSTALAIYYSVDRYDVKMFTELNELLYKLDTGEVDLDNLYTFYYGDNGLVDTTLNFRNALGGRTDEVFWGSPILISAPIKIDLPVAGITYPYSFSGKVKRDYFLAEKMDFISYLFSRLNYYQSVKAASLSEWKYQEIFNLIDNNPDTSWRGHRIFWHDNGHEEVILDLGQIKSINRLVWINWIRTLAPIGYNIDVSLDDRNWRTVKSVTDGPRRGDGEKIIEEFETVQARYIRFSINKTQSGDAPAVSEMEAVESKYKIDINEAFDFYNNPFAYIENEAEMKLILNRIYPLLNIRVLWATDKTRGYSEQPLRSIGSFYTLKSVIVPGGTRLGSLDIKVVNTPLSLTYGKIIMRNLSLKELENFSVIKKVSEN